tara:strand:- start:14011 stop:15039 length:1029 start_codon:yes stop_codon:yes gene_type:complete
LEGNYETVRERPVAIEKVIYKHNTMVNKSIAFLFIIICLTACKTKSIDVSEPPEGYTNNTTLKIAYATGALKLIENEFPVPDDLKEHKDVIYKTIDSTHLKLDVYHSKTLAHNTPLIVFVHGGAWKKGDKKNYLRYLVDYAKKGYVTATVQYRFTPKVTYREMIQDVEDAIRWLKKNAKAYHIDHTKVATVGGSAGGHLVLMNAFTNSSHTTAADSLSSKVQAVVNFYGPTDLTTDYARNNTSVTVLIGKSYTDAPEEYKEASPLFFVSKQAPPILTFHGTLDELVPFEQADWLHAALKEAGATSDYHLLEGWPHTMDASVKVNAYAQYHMDKFFEKYIPKP